ncbi:hypothetical protein Tco_1402106 [Tanacetum coccineum]
MKSLNPNSTHPGGPRRAFTVRKSVRPLPSHRLALRCTLHHLDRFTSGSLSSHSSLDHSSSGHSILGHSLSRHASPDTTVTYSSTPLRFVHPSLTRTLRCSEAYLHWRSPATTVTLSIHAMRALVPSRVDLLPPHKRFRDSISQEDGVEKDIDTDVLEDIKVDVMAVKVAVDRDVVTGIDVGIDMEVNVRVNVEDDVESRVDMTAGIDIPDAMLMPDAVEHLEHIEEQDIYEHNVTITRSGMTSEAIKELINRRVEEALVAYEAAHAANALKAESQSQNGSDGDNGNGGNGNGGDGNGGYGNWWNSHKRTIGTDAAFAMT